MNSKAEPGPVERFVPKRPVRLSARRQAALYCLFVLIAWGLGYSALNRYDPRKFPGLSDIKSYAAMVAGDPVPGPEHLQFRVLVPWVAKPFYRLARGHVGSWDPVLFGLLVSDSLFVAATALLIVMIGSGLLGDYPVSLLAALLYMVNFAVPNLRLVGLVDAGEGFFLLALYWSLSKSQFWPLPVIACLGTLAKESFIPFSIAFAAAWWLVAGEKLESRRASAMWIVSGWVASLATLIAIHYSITGKMLGLVSFASSLQGNYHYWSQFTSSLWDRNLWYVFIWLLPAGIPKLRQFPKSWLLPTAAASAMAFVLDGYYSGDYGTVGRALFSIAGPLLTLSTAKLLLDDFGTSR
jgi:hypothetical protein